MTSRQPWTGASAVALMMPVTLALAALLGATFAQPTAPARISSHLTQFDPERALAHAATLAADYPDRVVGSASGARARAWIAERFAELGLEVHSLPFTVTVASQARQGVQVWALSAGESADLVLVTAHYDVPQTRPAGQGDNAFGVGVLLELARVFASEPHQRSLLFLASDSQAYGRFWGAQNFIAQFEDRGQIRAVLDLDYGRAREPAHVALNAVGLRRGYAPLWLREIGRGSLETVGLIPQEPRGVREYLERAFPLGAGDHAAFLRAGIPAIGFAGGLLAPSHIAAGPETMRAPLAVNLGRAAELWLRTLDELDPLPAGDARQLRLNLTHHLSGDVIDYLQLLLFAPLFLAAAAAWRRQRARADELQPEFMAFMGLMIAGLDAYAVAYSLVALGLLPRYEMFPASPGDPFLLYPTWWAVAAIFGTLGLFGWLIFRPYRGWGRLADLLDVPHRRLTLLLLLSGLVILTWFLNGFAASALLGVAAYAWPWIEPRPTLWGKALNIGLAFAGALPLALTVSTLIAGVGLGPWWWFFTLSAAYGLFPLLGVILFLAGVALLIRFVRYGLRDVS